MKKLLGMFMIIVSLTAFGGVLDQNTDIMVAMDNTIDSKSAYDGQIWTGTIQGGLKLDDGTVIPQGTKVFGRVINSASSGNLTGTSKLAITISEIQVDGFNYGINTTGIGFEGESQGKNTAGTVAKTTALGAGINKLRGSSGSKGALAGAGVGAVGSALGGSGNIAIRQGEILQFRTTTSVVIGG